MLNIKTEEVLTYGTKNSSKVNLNMSTKIVEINT